MLISLGTYLQVTAWFTASNYLSVSLSLVINVEYDIICDVFLSNRYNLWYNITFRCSVCVIVLSVTRSDDALLVIRRCTIQWTSIHYWSSRFIR